MINPWTQVKSYHGHFEISQTPVNDLSIDDIKKDNLVLAVKISWKDSFKKNSK